jgi:NADH:ubiquinone oxidoreductase subunit C
MSDERATAEAAGLDLAELRVKLGDGLLEEGTLGRMPCVRVRREALLPALRFLQEDPAFRLHQLTELTVIDCLHLRETERFDAVYLLHNLPTGRRIAVKTAVPEEDPHLPSATGLWPAADWAEREASTASSSMDTRT